MSRCVFCKSDSTGLTTREHILPESLGGGDWAVLPDGLFCDRCQNRFGSEIEQQALAEYPFSFLRVFLGIPTKKGRMPWFNSWEGVVEASPQPGTFGYAPAAFFEPAFSAGQKSQIRLLAEPRKPAMVCRFLIKMGLEVVAADNAQDAFHSKFDAARYYALTGNKKSTWWYLQNERMREASRFIMQGVTVAEWSRTVRLEVMKLEDEQEMFHLGILYLDLFVPLTTRVQPDMPGMKAPEFRLFGV